jgi:hypothetical protein
MSKRRTRKVYNEDSIWGKNKRLEKLWSDLADGKCLIVVFKNGKHTRMRIKGMSREKYATLFNELDDNPEVAAVLTSSMSTDIYTEHLYPKAKGKTPEEVIRHYKKYFKFQGTTPKDMVEKGHPLMKKALYVW